MGPNLNSGPFFYLKANRLRNDDGIALKVVGQYHDVKCGGVHMLKTLGFVSKSKTALLIEIGRFLEGHFISAFRRCLG